MCVVKRFVMHFVTVVIIHFDMWLPVL